MKPQIEKVERHSFSGLETCCVISYHPTMDMVLQTNFISEENARENLTKFKVGIWKPKN